MDSEMHNFNRDVYLFDRTVGYDNALRIEAVDYVRNVMLVNLKVGNINVNRFGSCLHHFHNYSPGTEINPCSLKIPNYALTIFLNKTHELALKPISLCVSDDTEW